MKVLRLIGQIAIVAIVAVAFTIASASDSEAAKKKRGAKAMKPATGICQLQARAPVCGVKGKQRFTYSNACFANADGAKVSKAAACKGGKAAKGKRAAKKGGKKKK